MRVTPVSARTTNPNTPESDMQRYVMHTVTFSDGSTKQVLATDPMDAIEKCRKK